MSAKSYKDIGDLPLEFEDESILDLVVELYGQFKSKKQINEILTEELKLEKPISFVTISVLISRAKKKICETYKVIDPTEYKGRIIYCIELILGGRAKPRARLKALEMLAIYTGVEQGVQEDPGEYAQRVVEAIKEADASVDGTGVKETKEVGTQAESDSLKSE